MLTIDSKFSSLKIKDTFDEVAFKVVMDVVIESFELLIWFISDKPVEIGLMPVDVLSVELVFVVIVVINSAELPVVGESVEIEHTSSSKTALSTLEASSHTLPQVKSITLSHALSQVKSITCEILFTVVTERRPEHNSYR
jgi:hypothetical protein